MLNSLLSRTSHTPQLCLRWWSSSWNFYYFFHCLSFHIHITSLLFFSVVKSIDVKTLVMCFISVEVIIPDSTRFNWSCPFAVVAPLWEKPFNQNYEQRPFINLMTCLLTFVHHLKVPLSGIRERNSTRSSHILFACLIELNFYLPLR